MTPDEIRAFKPRGDRPVERMLHEALLALLPAEGDDAGGAVPTCAVDPETVSRACDRFHGATFHLFLSKPVTGYEVQFRIGMAEAIKASRETQP